MEKNVKKREKIIISIILIVTFVGAIVNILIMFDALNILTFYENVGKVELVVGIALLIAVGMIGFVLGYYINKSEKSNKYNDYLSDRLKDEKDNQGKIEEILNKYENDYKNETERFAKEIKKKFENRAEANIIALMLKNSEEADEYFKISKSHVKISFLFSVFFCIIGICFLGYAIASYTLYGNLDVSIISIAGGTITEVIAGTVFWVHNKSTKQLNHYYDALHENEKFLSTVTLTDKISEQGRDEILIKIIESQLKKE